ncbi:NADH:flavin oxidoreductase [Pseudomonas fluorescens]|nr:NADH:flavin oxidoreductase [Pseudomonas fluorescens]
MNNAASPLFTPLKIRNVRLSNRIVMSPMTRNFSPLGIPGEDVTRYYVQRVLGEVGLIITEGVGIDDPSALGYVGLGKNDIPVLHGEAALAGWRRVVQAVHTAGGTIFPQMWHMGVMKEQGSGRHPEAPPLRPSGSWGPRGRHTSLDPAYIDRMQAATEPMSEEAIADVIAAYGRSATNARDVGFDGIAIHGAHGYLIDTFLWDETNRRTDRWGGNRRNRSLFAVEVVKAIRVAVGDEMPIAFRFSQWKQQDFKARLAASPRELEEILGPISDAGVDLFDASARYFDRAEFEGSPLGLAGWAKKITGKLAMTVGGVGMNQGMYDSLASGGAEASNHQPQLVRRFECGEFDLIGVGRALIADPQWARKMRLGLPFSPFTKESLMSLK